MTHSAPHNAKLRKFASMMPAFFVGLLNRISSIDLPLAPSAACFSAIKRFMALKRSRNTSTDSFVISVYENRQTHLIWFQTFSKYILSFVCKIKLKQFRNLCTIVNIWFCRHFALWWEFTLMRGVCFVGLIFFYTCFVSKSKFYTPWIEWTSQDIISVYVDGGWFKPLNDFHLSPFVPVNTFSKHNKALNALLWYGAFFVIAKQTVTVNGKILLENIFILFPIQFNNVNIYNRLNDFQKVLQTLQITFRIEYRSIVTKFTTHTTEWEESVRFDMCCQCMRMYACAFSVPCTHAQRNSYTLISLSLSLILVILRSANVKHMSQLGLIFHHVSVFLLIDSHKAAFNSLQNKAVRTISLQF